jgi:hypothetical protein
MGGISAAAASAGVAAMLLLIEGIARISISVSIYRPPSMGHASYIYGYRCIVFVLGVCRCVGV